MKILAPVHGGTDYQFLPGFVDDVGVFPGKFFDGFDIMLVHDYLSLWGFLSGPLLVILAPGDPDWLESLRCQAANLGLPIRARPLAVSRSRRPLWPAGPLTDSINPAFINLAVFLDMVL